MFLRNAGTSSALDVSAVLSADDALSTVGYPDTADWGNMAAAEEDFGVITGGYYYSYAFDVSAAASAGQSLGFSLAIEDRFGNTWSDTFQLPVH